MRLASRGSRLARAQFDLAARALYELGHIETALVVIESRGDAQQDVPAAEMDGQGWFTTEVERAVIDGRADCAVHSAKDLPTALADDMQVAAYLPRADVRDGLLCRTGGTLAELEAGTRVATSSPRRAALALAINPGVVIVPMRGNVDTRLSKLDSGEVDALLLACAGLDRLGLGDRVTERLDPAIFVPAPAQGVIALEVRDHSGAAELVGCADHATTRNALCAERALLLALGGGCLLPLGAWARSEDGQLVLTAALPIEGKLRHIEVRGDLGAPEALAQLAAWQLR